MPRNSQQTSETSIMPSPINLPHNILLTSIILVALGCVHPDASKANPQWTENRDAKAKEAPHLLDFNKPQTFNFVTPSTAAKNTLLITPETTYGNAHGYGFDLNTRINNAGEAFYFSVRVPPGNYRVLLDLGHPTLPSSNTVKAESRRLYLHNVATAPGEIIRHEFVVNVRNALLKPPEPNAPGGMRVLLKSWEQHNLHWDDKLTLEFNGAAPQPRSVTLQKIDVPTIYLVGDSTVTDQPNEPAASWGQMLPVFFDSSVAIANHAESGETLKSFITSLRFAKVMESIKPGDYLFIQFGHNDQKKHWPQTYVEAETTYQDYLNIFIAEARLRGATPVLITSMQRRTFDNLGKIKNSHGSYPEAVRHFAHQKKVALIDLDAMSVKLYEALGESNAPLAFNDYGKDITHHNSYGAYQLAKCVVEGIRRAQLPLAARILAHVPLYNPATPESPTDFFLSPSPKTR